MGAAQGNPGTGLSSSASGLESTFGHERGECDTADAHAALAEKVTAGGGLERGGMHGGLNG